MTKKQEGPGSVRFGCGLGVERFERFRFFGSGGSSAKIGNGPNTVSESTVSNTELSEFFGAH